MSRSDCFPICEACKEEITEEQYIEIGGEILCINCARDNARELWSDYLEQDYLMSTEKYIEDEYERRAIGDEDDI